MANANDKLAASCTGTALESRVGLYHIMQEARYLKDGIERGAIFVGRNAGDDLEELKRKFAAFSIEAMMDGDTHFFEDVVKLLQSLQSGEIPHPVDYFLLMLHHEAFSRTRPKEGFFAKEIFDLLKKNNFHCKDIKSVRDAAERVGIKLRKDISGVKPKKTN